MKIGYFADGPWSHKALEKISEDKRFEISFIIPRYDVQDPVLKEWAGKLGVDYLPIENVNHPDSISKINAYAADIFVSMSFNQIMKKKILKSAALGFINCHAGALPFYRGRNILNWALINDEKEFGVTVHYIDEGIDTGDIILQKKSNITDRDDYSSLLKRATELCAETLYEALGRINDGSVVRVPQSSIHPVGLYCGKRKLGDEWVDWNWPSRRIFNFIRGIAEPGPCARTVLDNHNIILKTASMIDEAPHYHGTSGEVVGIYDEKLIIKTGDSTLRIDSYQIDSNTNSDSENTISKIRVGHRFGENYNNNVKELRQRIIELEYALKRMG